METKNFLSMLPRVLISLFVLLLFVGCQTGLKRRLPPTVQKDKGMTESPVETPQIPPQFDGERPKAAKGSFVRRRAPRLGVILGGGGMLTFAQIGFLREMNAQKVPIHSITGLEWGALVSGIYSLNGRAHESEWQLLKFPVKKLNQKGVFGSGGPPSVDAFDDYLKGIFKGKRVKNGKVPFACPYLDASRGRIRAAKNGSYREVLKMCWPFVPHFNYSDRMASPMAIREAAQLLRKKGAELILYVDVIDKNLIFTSSQRKKHPAANLIWLQTKAMSASLKNFGVDEVVPILLAGSNYMASESMRLMVRMGQMKSRPLIKRFARKHDY